MKGYIYGIRCPLSNEIRYIGQTSKSLNYRLRQHINKTKSKVKNSKRLTHNENWIKILLELKIDNLISIEKIEECDVNSLDEREIFWISKFKNKKLTNITEGGSQPRGYHWNHTEESKKKISIGLKKSELYYLSLTKERVDKMLKTKKENGYEISDETKEKISQGLKNKMIGDKNPFYGKKHSDESKRKIGEKNKEHMTGEKNPFYGKKHSNETKKILSEKIKGKLQKKIYMLDDNKNIVREFSIIDDINNYLNVVFYYNALRHYLDKEIKYKGYYWKRK